MNKIIFLLIIITNICHAQLLPANFEGQIKFKIQWHNVTIAQGKCGDLREKRMITKIGNYYTAKDSSVADSDQPNYLKQKFLIREKTMKVIYFNPNKNANDTTDIFPMTMKDTINGVDEYLIYADSTQIWDAAANKWSYREVAISANSVSRAIRRNDTVLKIINEKVPCYAFEKFAYNKKTDPGPSHLRTFIYVEKQNLLPVQEEAYVYFPKMGHCNVPADKWVLRKKVYVTSAKASNFKAGKK